MANASVSMRNIWPIRLLGIVGYENRVNDIVYFSPYKHSDEATIYFGGDVQDFTENMQTHQNNQKYIKWNLESTVRSLHVSFPESKIVIIRPSRIEYKTFSCFKNFVPSTNYGVPNHVPMHNAIRHLQKLLENLSNTLENLSQQELCDLMTSSKKAICSADENGIELNSEVPSDTFMNSWKFNFSKIRLIGFSKGCVVLNQFLHEFHHLKSESHDEAVEFIPKIKEMYWLDGGHSGGKNTWVTSSEILQTYAELGISTYIHVTPYQVEDHKRPWIRKEERIFHHKLNSLGANVHRELHFREAEPTLDLHFDVLRIFKPVNSIK